MYGFQGVTDEEDEMMISQPGNTNGSVGRTFVRGKLYVDVEERERAKKLSGKGNSDNERE